MKINFICKENKEENKYIEPYIKYYIPKYYSEMKALDVDCPDINNQHTSPDYFITQPKILVEIKEVHDRKELEVWKAWDHNVNRLDQEWTRLDEWRGGII